MCAVCSAESGSSGLVWLVWLVGVAVVVGVWLVFGVGVAGALSTGPLPESTGTRPAGVAVPWPGGRGAGGGDLASAIVTRTSLGFRADRAYVAGLVASCLGRPGLDRLGFPLTARELAVWEELGLIYERTVGFVGGISSL